MKKKEVYEYLSYAESGDITAQSKLCQAFYDNDKICKSLPDDFWGRIDKLAQKDKDYANFILHCRYFDDPIQSNLSFYYIRKSIRYKEIPLAVLRLGISYEKGIGTTVNNVLSHYFYEMAFDMGCLEAEEFIHQEYESGRRFFIDDMENDMKNYNHLSPRRLAKYKKWIDDERIKKNYGYLSRLREYIPLLYPDYNEEKAYDDILNNRDTVDADICYSLSTSNNQTEVDLEILERFMNQLYAPISKDFESFLNAIIVDNEKLLRDIEKELLQCYVNLTSSYDNLCKKFSIEKTKNDNISALSMYPYVSVPLLGQMRMQAFRCVLSLRNVVTEIKDLFLHHLDDDVKLLNICEYIKDQDVQLLAISYVELNIDIKVIIEKYQQLLYSYNNCCFEELADYLNEHLRRLDNAGIKYEISDFTPDNLPPIDLN